MSDHDLGMKIVEEAELDLFLDAYEVAFRQRLRVRQTGERPDFVCVRGNGRLVGVELTKVMRDPESASWDRTMNGNDSADPYDTLDRVYGAIERKEHKRGSGDWQCRDSTILVLQVMDCPLDDLAPFLDDAGPAEFSGHGFAEIFIADHSELEAYGAVELFGLYPRRRWGTSSVIAGSRTVRSAADSAAPHGRLHARQGVRAAVVACRSTTQFHQAAFLSGSRNAGARRAHREVA